MKHCLLVFDILHINVTQEKCLHVVHFNVPRDWFETSLHHQKRYSEGGKKNRWCRGLLGGVIFGMSKTATDDLCSLWYYERS